MKFDKRMVLVAAAAFALAFFVAQGGGNSPFPNPFVPAKKDRPVLKFIVKAAKSLLWIAVFAEERPADPQYTDHASIGPDGRQLLNHAEGW